MIPPKISKVIQPFDNLFQHIKISDPRMYEVLKKIQDSLVNIGKVVFESVESPVVAPVVAGNGFILPVPGLLGIDDAVSNTVYLNADLDVGSIFASVDSAPTTGDINFDITVGGDVWASGVIVDSTTTIGIPKDSLTSSRILSAKPIQVNLTSVGLGYPGKNLNIFIYGA